MSIFGNNSVMPEATLEPEQQKLLVELKDRWDKAVDAGDYAAANKIKRQRDMFLESPEQVVPPRPASDKADEFINEFAESVRNYWRGFTPDSITGEQTRQQPRSGYGVAGAMGGALAANPFDVGRRATTKMAQAGIEGFAAPAESLDERMGNAAFGIGTSGILQGIGGVANRMFDFNADNPSLREARDYAAKNNLDAPYIDDYSDNVMAGLGGWLVDEPMVVGRLQQVPRGRKLEQHARWQADSRTVTEGLEESIRRQHDADWLRSSEMYEDLFNRYPTNINDERLFDVIGNLNESMAKVKHLLPASITGKLDMIASTKPGDLRHWHEVRSLMREHVEKMKASGKPGRRYVGNAVDAIDEMMYRALPDEGRAALAKADKFYAEAIPKYRGMKVLANAIQEGDEDAVINFLVNPGTSPHNAKKIWNSLHETGKANAMAQIHQRAVYEATLENGQFSAMKYSNFWRGFRDKAERILPKKEVEELAGLEALYGMSRAVDSEGSHWIQSRGVGNFAAMAGLGGAGALATAGMFSPGDLMVGLTTTAALATLMRTRVGNKALRALGKAQSGAEAAKSMYQLQKMLVRNPHLAQEAGFTQEQIESLGAQIRTLDVVPNAYNAFADQMSRGWQGFNNWAAQEGEKYRVEE